MAFGSFAPVTGLAGGALIGLSAATLLLFNGDVLGASGMMSSFVISPKNTLTAPSRQWNLFFVIAFFGTSRICLLIDPTVLDDAAYPGIPVVSPLGFIIGGFLVGFGTRLGNGCTTGHGICGMARLSVRSLIGVMSFMFSGFLFASVCPVDNPHIRDMTDALDEHPPTLATHIAIASIIALMTVFALVGLVARHPSSSDDAVESQQRDEVANNRRKILPSIFAGIIFASGLVVSQMTLYSKIFGFLNLTLIPKGNWDPTLVMVMGGGFVVSFISYQWVQSFNLFKNSNALHCPLGQNSTVGKFSVPTNKVIDFKLIFGEIIFGVGWGVAGLCPGPAMVRASAGYPNELLRWWPMFLVGAFLAEKLKVLSSCSNINERNVSPDDDTIGSTQATVPCQGKDEEVHTECV